MGEGIPIAMGEGIPIAEGVRLFSASNSQPAAVNDLFSASN
jgi:hypothetical protein